MPTVVDDDGPPSAPPRLSGTKRALQDDVGLAGDITDRTNAADALLLYRKDYDTETRTTVGRRMAGVATMLAVGRTATTRRTARATRRTTGTTSGTTMRTTVGTTAGTAIRRTTGIDSRGKSRRTSRGTSYGPKWGNELTAFHSLNPIPSFTGLVQDPTKSNSPEYPKVQPTNPDSSSWPLIRGVLTIEMAPP